MSSLFPAVAQRSVTLDEGKQTGITDCMPLQQNGAGPRSQSGSLASTRPSPPPVPQRWLDIAGVGAVAPLYAAR